MTAPADELAELKAAAEKLRTARFAGAMTATPAVAALIATREPLAKLLEDCAELHEAHEPGPLGTIPPGCQWCADEDFPCADMRNALAVARAISSAKRTGMQVNIHPKPADQDDAFARGFAAGKRAR